MPRHYDNEIVETSTALSYGKTVMRGGLHTAASQGLIVGCQITSVLVLSRLLTPRDFGLVAMIGPVIAFLSMFKEMGLLQAVIQKKDLTYGQLNTLFWINVGVSLALSLLLFLAAPAVALFYDEPALTWLLRISALTVLLTSLGAQHFALLNREMRFGLIAINSSAVAASTLLVAVFFALIEPSAWALVAGTLAGAVVGTLMVWIWVPWSPGRPTLAAGTRALMGFGAGVTGFKLANFFSRNLDNVLIGRVWGGSALGFYDRAYKLLLFPINQVAQPLSRIMIPVLSRLQDEPERYSRSFFRVFGLMQLAVLPGVAAATALADTAVPFMLGEKWAASAPIFTALGVAGLAQPLANPTGWLWISQGRTTEMAWWGLASASISCIAFVIGVQFGVLELATAYAAVSVLKLVPLWYLICRKGPIGVECISSHILPVFFAGLAALGMIYGTRQLLPDPAIVKLALGGALCYATFALTLSFSAYGRTVLGETLSLAAGAVQLLRTGLAKGGV